MLAETLGSHVGWRKFGDIADEVGRLSVEELLDVGPTPKSIES